MKTTILNGLDESRTPPSWLRLCAVAAASLAVALALTACENVATYMQPSLVRVIDASYIAPAINVEVEGELLASNIGQGTITPYGTLPANIAAPIRHHRRHRRRHLVVTNGTLSARPSALGFPHR